jgi:S-phase kinase-associated protein 1
MSTVSFKVVTEDNVEFELTEEEARNCTTLSNMIDDLKDACLSNETTPIPHVTSITFEKVLEYLKGSVFEKDIEISDWNKNFLSDLQKVELVDVLLAANYLDYQSLLADCVYTIASDVKKCKTEKEIRELYGIVNDFTPEQLEQIKRENSWCDWSSITTSS